MAKKLAVLPSLLIAGSLSAQTSDQVQENTDAAKPAPKAGEVIELPKVEVEGQTQPKPSSPKFTAAPVDTPQTVVVIPQEVYSQQAAANLSDVLRNTPGITFTAGENGNVNTGDSFFMRGFDSSNAIFVDGVRDSGSYSRDIYNIEQVEIAKGPASDNGRATAGGYVNLGTKSPHLETSRIVTASYGFDATSADDRRRATIDINQPLAASPIAGTAFRLNALGQDGGVAGRQYAENNRWAVAPSLALGLGTPTRLIAAFEHFEQNNLPEFGVPSPVVKDVIDTSFGSSIDRDNFYGLLSDYDDVTSDAVTLRLEHDITPDLKLSNQTRYQFTDREAIYTSFSAYSVTAPNPTPATPVNASRQSNFRTNQVISNITNLSAQFSTGFIEHNFSTGLEFSQEIAYSKKFTGLGTVLPIAPANPSSGTIFDPNPNRPVTGFNPVRNGFTESRIDTAAVYLYDTLKLSEHWQITGGGRVEYYQAYLDDLAGTTATAKETNDLLGSGKIGLVFKPVQQGSLYVAYGTSVRPPLTNALSTAATTTPGNTGSDAPGAKPQRSHIYEAGVKWDFFQSRLSTTLAVFTSKNENISTATDPATGLPTAFGDQKVEGLEAGVTGKITDSWFVFAGVALLETENRNPSNAAQDGSDIQFTPDVSGSLWTTYAFPGGFVLGGGVQYFGSATRSLTAPSATTQAFELPDYWVGNVMASYEITRNLKVRLNVDNVTDELYARSLNNGGGRVYLGAPRTYTISGEFKF